MNSVKIVFSIETLFKCIFSGVISVTDSISGIYSTLTLALSVII